ncbi:hypothetical protein A176_007158 [Myxococcus hansupus]|uniref:Uncharacterized protein n=1 Tax=Pseudomyxococcus hansupus TaxID=1297742 RepID=A0A0H4X3K3_9BACT|nr:hypothetical protein A176_007158 [Myxococcus hansupus]
MRVHARLTSLHACSRETPVGRRACVCLFLMSARFDGADVESGRTDGRASMTHPPGSRTSVRPQGDACSLTPGDSRIFVTRGTRPRC